MDASTIGPRDAVSSAASETSAKPKLEYISAVRGAALIYIVFDHTVGELAARFPSGGSLWADFLRAYDAFDYATAGTRIPVLFFLAGLFVERSAARGVVRFITGRMRTLVWPLALWWLVQTLAFLFEPWRTELFSDVKLEGALHVMAGVTTFDPRRVLSGWWLMSGALWFLDVLIVYLTLFLLLRKLPKMLVLIAAGVWFVASLYFTTAWDGGPYGPMLVALGRYFIFFWLAVTVSDWAVRRQAQLTPGQMGWAAVLFVGVAAACVVFGFQGREVVILVSGLPAIPLLLNAGKWLARSPARSLVLWSGEASLLILCLHMLAMPLALAVAVAANVTSPLLLLPLGFGGGLGLCLLADFIQRRLRWSSALGFHAA